MAIPPFRLTSWLRGITEGPRASISLRSKDFLLETETVLEVFTGQHDGDGFRGYLGVIDIENKGIGNVDFSYGAKVST